MAAGERPDAAAGGALEGESLAEVLASIRALVSAETEARVAGPGQGDTVLMLTPDMRLDSGPQRSGEMLADGIDAGTVAVPAPAFDEQALRELINSIVREELQGELGDRIGRNLRKLIRREVAQVLEEQRRSAPS
jgi:hypothetical protein